MTYSTCTPSATTAIEPVTTRWPEIKLVGTVPLPPGWVIRRYTIAA